MGRKRYRIIAQNMNIAILGGSFDPPHSGHVVAVKRLIKLFNFDQVWLMPCYQHPFNKKLSHPSKRLEMAKHLENEKIKASDFELERRSTSYTIDTLSALKAQYPNDHFSWIIGSDQIKNFTKWKNWQEIIDKFKLIIIPRTNFRKAKEMLKDIVKSITYPKNIVFIDKGKFSPIYISSTKIRQRVKEERSIKNLVPKKVEEYIIKHRLYA
ncbi:MAG: nicotinate (nicotinamide) nucleotide adenylyltransferase [Candidatus Levybacteria bacterium]|nr:nicotinate (nicotinamide) nucleotide adenylyltransferase [Candidatus Levybacteria bacterium]